MYWEDCLAFGAVRVVRALHFEVKGEGEAPSGVKGQGESAEAISCLRYAKTLSEAHFWIHRHH